MSENNILESILENEYFLVPHLIKTKWNDDKTEIINGLLNDSVTQQYSHNYEYLDAQNEDPEFTFKNIKGVLHQDMNYLLQMSGDRNIYIGTNTPAQLFMKKNPQIYNIPFNKFYEDFSKIHSGISNLNYKPHLNKYLDILPYLKTHEINDNYICENRFDVKIWNNYFPSYTLKQFVPKKIQREIEEALKNPSKNIDYLKSNLDLNKDLGFYCYQDVPLICLHEFMLAEGKSMKSIAERCSNSKDVCRYCGGELIVDIEAYKLDLPKLAYRIIYTLTDLLHLGIYQEQLENLIKTSVQVSIDNLELDDLDDNELKINAFVATFAYKIFKDLQKDMAIRNSSNFLTMIRDCWSKVGWDNQIVENLMNNEERFYEYNHILNMILKFQENISQLDIVNTITYLFLQGIKDHENPFQKIYLKDKLKLGEMVDMMLKILGNTTSIEDYKLIINDSEKTNLNIVLNQVDIKSGSGLKSFFSMWWKYICPVNLIHKFEGDKCKFCGINQKDSNSIDSTYEKYKSDLEKIINPIIEKSFHQTITYRTNIIKSIESQPETIPKLMNMDFYLKDEYSEILNKKLCDLIHIGDISELEVNTKNNIKLLNYILSEMNIKQEIIENELFSISSNSLPKFGQIIMVL